MAPFVLPVEEAQVGDIGLLSYQREAWEGFITSASQAETSPYIEVALAGFADPSSDRVIVVPEVQAEEPVVAFWRAGEDDLLEAVVANTGEREPSPRFFRQLKKLIGSGRVRRNEGGCTLRRTELACAGNCKSGICGVESWYEERSQVLLYRCVCQED